MANFGVFRPADLLMDKPKPVRMEPVGSVPKVRTLPGRPARGAPRGPDGLQAVKAGIKQLLQRGFNEEQIVDVILRIASEKNISIQPDHVRVLIDQVKRD